MGQLVSDHSNDLNYIIGTEETKLHWQMNIDSGMDGIGSFGTTPIFLQARNPSAYLNLTYYINLMARKNSDTILTEIDTKVASLMSECRGYMQSRHETYSVDDSPHILEYRLLIPDVEAFNAMVVKAHMMRIDAEFTKALEAKLTED